MSKKVIIISGGTSGLGYETAKLLSPDHQIVILAPDQNKLSQVAEDLNCEFELCDITNQNQVETSVKNILARHQKIDCLINNAGIWLEGDLEENAYTEIFNTFNVNTIGAIYLTKAVIPSMKSNASGQIINVISQAGLYARHEHPVYASSKWALTGLTKSLQSDLKNFGIRITGLYPGKMNTPLFSKLNYKKDMSDALNPIDVAKAISYLLSLPDHVAIPEIGITHPKH